MPDNRMPQSYTARINDAGSGTMHLTHGGTGVYIPIPVGVSMVHLSWEGRAWCRAQFRPDGEASSNREIAFIPTASTIAFIPTAFQIASDDPKATMFLQSSSDLGGDAQLRAGVIVVPI